jgi:hypothetical protein
VNKLSFTLQRIHAIDAAHELPFMNAMNPNPTRKAALLASLENQTKTLL